MQTDLKRLRIRSVIDHVLIGLVIVFGTIIINESWPVMETIEKVQLLFICNIQ